MSACMPLGFVQVSSSSLLALQLSQNSSWAFYAMKMILSPFYCATSGAVQSPIKLVKSRNSIKEIPVVGLWFGHHLLCIITHAQ